ncbi:MAG: hypothetical protein ABI986_02180 [Chloroflexota bacterium]
MEDSVTMFSCSLIQPVEGLDRAEYEIVRNSILKNLLAYGAMSPDQLVLLVKDHLNHKLYGSLQRYYEAVQKDLEARGEILIHRNPQPHLIELAL